MFGLVFSSAVNYCSNDCGESDAGAVKVNRKTVRSASYGSLCSRYAGTFVVFITAYDAKRLQPASTDINGYDDVQ